MSNDPFRIRKTEEAKFFFYDSASLRLRRIFTALGHIYNFIFDPIKRKLSWNLKLQSF